MKQQTGGRFGARIFRAILTSLAAAAFIGLFASAPSLANEKLGTWLNTDRKGKIELRECGDMSLCGKLVWLKDSHDEKGKPWRDLLNPDPKLRKRAVVGIDVLIGTKKIGPMTWQGQIYDPEVGKVYYLKHLKVGKDKVEIKGCLSTGWPCRTKYWTRTRPLKAPAPVKIAKRIVSPKFKTAAKPIPRPRTAPPAAVAPPMRAAVTRPLPAAPPVQPQIPYPSRPPQARAPAPPAPVTAPVPPDVTAALPRPTASPARGSYLVQVAARRSHNEALQAYNELQLRYPRILGKLLPEVVRADLGQRGIWYRVGVGPMAQQSAALSFCQRLKAVGADCLIRRR